jgi:hypothetical protein
MSMINVPESVHKMIVKKQLELYEINGKKTNLSEIAEKAIIRGIDLI